MPTDRDRVALSPSDINDLETWLAAKSPPLGLGDVYLAINDIDKRWDIFKITDRETLIYCMSWVNGNWETV